jgi:hypothetical protein
MKLIAEAAQNIEVLAEANADGTKALYITGPFMEANVVNGNKRVYSAEVMNNAVNNYVKNKVTKGNAYGELNHPSGPQIDLERACILIKELDMNDNGQVMGKARVLSTPMGNIVKGLLESECRVGVSSRGMGSLKSVNGINEVQKDFKLVTAADVVADPSAPNAFVNGIMEGVDWVFNENTGEWVEAVAHKYKHISERKRKEELTEAAKLHLFNTFLNKL